MNKNNLELALGYTGIISAELNRVFRCKEYSKYVYCIQIAIDYSQHLLDILNELKIDLEVKNEKK